MEKECDRTTRKYDICHLCAIYNMLFKNSSESLKNKYVCMYACKKILLSV